MSGSLIVDYAEMMVLGLLLAFPFLYLFNEFLLAMGSQTRGVYVNVKYRTGRFFWAVI